MKLTILTVCSLVLLQSFVNPLGFDLPTIKDILQGSKDVFIGTLTNAGSFLPSPAELFGGTKNLLAGMPLEYVSTSINSVCSTLMSSQSVIPKIMPDKNSINFQLMTACNKYTYSVLSPGDLLNNTEFDVTKKTVILVTGWRTTITSSKTIEELSKAYICRGDVNFLAIDAASYVDTLFSWSALNTEKIGEYLGESLVKLETVVPLESIHLIGHSLGAHICGSAGRTFNQLTNRFIPRITALDPAKPCFNEGESLCGLMRGDADFIDVIHTNTGVLGKRDPTGDVDFYPDGLVPLPTGCLTVVCAHERAWLYYVESVYPGNEYNFMAKRCTSLSKLKQNKCTGVAVPMGYAATSNLKGNYVLEVRGSAPFGMNGSKTREAQYATCGTCAKSSTVGSTQSSSVFRPIKWFKKLF
ncbi:vitellogenin-1-like [Eupeodes corollae]|uniref:vitellogenin-1-like n=1 Tax=Eupeodes corollae TaxID=290404 RepID=UPI0024908461|nr:vitellogenin-1-like [Eupeodes corollae]